MLYSTYRFWQISASSFRRGAQLRGSFGSLEGDGFKIISALLLEWSAWVLWFKSTRWTVPGMQSVSPMIFGRLDIVVLKVSSRVCRWMRDGEGCLTRPRGWFHH